MECKEHLAVLLGNTSATSLAEARKHLLECPRCRQKLKRLRHDILTLDEYAIPCAECEARLPEYLNATEKQRTTESYFWAVTQHLKSCPDCQVTYEDLLAMADEQVPEPSFWERLSESVYRLSAKLFLLSPQRPVPFPYVVEQEPAFATARIKGANETNNPSCIRVFSLRFPPESNLQGVMSSQEKGGFLTITVQVRLADSSDPAFGAQVGLYQQSDDLPREIRLIEEDSRSVRFDGVACDKDYYLRVSYGGRDYDHPLDASTRDN